MAGLEVSVATIFRRHLYDTGQVAMGVRSKDLDAFGDDFAWSLLDATPDAMFIVDGGGKIVFFNSRAAELFVRAHDELLGRHIEDLIPDELRQAHKAHRTRYRAEPTNRPMGAGLVLRACRSDGSEFPVEISLSPMLLGDDLYSVAAVRDITDRVEAEDHLHRVLTTLDASDDGVFIFDAAALRFNYVNEGAVRLVGYGRDDLSTMTPLHLNPVLTAASYHDLIERLQAQPEQSITVAGTLRRKDGTDIAVEETFQSAASGRDGTHWVISLARDISARLASERELRLSQDALREAEQVMAVAEDRERIARDLHDTVIQRLFGAGLNLQATMATADERVQGRLASTIDDLDATIKELRMAIFSLQGSSSAAPGGLRGKVLEIITEASRTLGFDPRLQFDGPIETIDESVAAELLPTLREALTNVARHADARTVRIGITVADDIALVVTDDGVGVPDDVIGGSGLDNIRRRAVRLGGSAEITALPDRGTEVLWRSPTTPKPGAGGEGDLALLSD